MSAILFYVAAPPHAIPFPLALLQDGWSAIVNLPKDKIDLARLLSSFQPYPHAEKKGAVQIQILFWIQILRHSYFQVAL